VPFNISAVGQEEIDAAGWVASADLLREMPGIVPDGGGEQQQITMLLLFAGLKPSLSGPMLYSELIQRKYLYE